MHGDNVKYLRRNMLINKYISNQASWSLTYQLLWRCNLLQISWTLNLSLLVALQEINAIISEMFFVFRFVEIREAKWNTNPETDHGELARHSETQCSCKGINLDSLNHISIIVCDVRTANSKEEDCSSAGFIGLLFQKELAQPQRNECPPGVCNFKMLSVIKRTKIALNFKLLVSIKKSQGQKIKANCLKYIFIYFYLFSTYLSISMVFVTNATILLGRNWC